MSSNKEDLPDKKEEKEESSSPRKTLGLKINVDVNKVLEKKEKRIRGGTTVEVKSSKPKEATPAPVVEVKEVSDSKKEEQAAVKSSNLTDGEKSLRLQVLEKAENTTKGASDVGASSFKVVVREQPKETKVEEEKLEVEKTAEEASVQQAKEGKEDFLQRKMEIVKTVVDSSKINKKIDSKEDKFANTDHKKVEVQQKVENKSKDLEEDSVEASKKAKKKLAEEQLKRRTSLSSLKNVSVEVLVDEEDEEALEEEDFEEEEVKPNRFNYAVRRKNKRRDSHIKKVKLVKEIELAGAIKVIDLAAKLAEKTKTLIHHLEKLGITAKDNTLLDLETSEILVTELGHKLKLIDDALVEKEFTEFNDKVEDLAIKAPVVTIMGHVDHGKTTLLDTIRKTNVVGKEHGGITQHIGAYQIKTDAGKVITFLDTPGHEAFSQIRSRGSKVTDIVVLVVAADDGVKQQTVEAINHAKLANVPIILAINKIDKPDKNPQRVKTELLQHNIVVEELGGDVLSVEISAKNNIGIDKLLETILLQAEVLDIKTNYKALGKGSIIEVKVQKGIGALATVLVERGVVKVGDFFVCGTSTGRVKIMMNDRGERLKEALPAMPIEVSGFNSNIEAGDDFIIVPSEAKAMEIADYRLNKQKKGKVATKGISYFLSDNIENIKVLPIVVKTDTQGSLEAIIGSLNKITHKDLEIKVIHSAVGEINESDVMLTRTAKGVIIGFNARANTKAADIAKKEGVDIRYHSIIYNLIDDIKLILSGLLDPNIVEKIIGYAEVREVFNITKVGKIAGCYVKDGLIRRASYVRLLRDNVVIHSGVLSQLKRFKDDVKEVSSNFECGVAIENYEDIKVGDLIECYEKTEVREKVE